MCHKFYSGIILVVFWHCRYIDQFPEVLLRTTLMYEISYSYFDNAAVPARIEHMMPKVKLVFVLDDPAIRAYSIYQVWCHFRLNKDYTCSMILEHF